MRSIGSGKAGRKSTVAKQVTQTATVPGYRGIPRKVTVSTKSPGRKSVHPIRKLISASKRVARTGHTANDPLVPGFGRATSRIIGGRAAGKAAGKAVGKVAGGGNSGAGNSGSGYGGTNYAGNPNVGMPVDESMADTGATLYNPKYADQLANQEYNPQLANIRDQQGQQKSDAAQALKDISDWYGQVSDAQGIASARNVTAGQTAQSSIGKITQDLMSSLGGSANMGAGMIGAQGAIDAGTSGQISQAENQYQTDLAPLLKLEQAGASRNENVRQSRLAHDLSQQLLLKIGEKGASRSANLLKLQGLNNDILNSRLDSHLKIKEYNNSLAQQKFSNRLSSQEAAVAAAMTGAQISQLKTKTGGFTPWMKLDPSQRQDLITAAVANSVDAQGGLRGNPANAWNLARQYLQGQGYSSARSGVHNAAHTSIGQLLQAAIAHAIALNQQRAAAQAQNG